MTYYAEKVSVSGKGEYEGRIYDDRIDPGSVREFTSTVKINDKGAEYITNVIFKCTG